MGSDESHFSVSVGSDGQSHKTVSTNHNLSEEKGEPKRYRTEVLPLISLKTVLNWANVCSRTYLEVFGEASWFFIGQTFLREPSWKYSSKCSSGVKKASLSTFWEHSLYWTIIASDWLGAELSCG